MLASSSSLSAVFAQVTTPSGVFSVQEDEIPSDIQQQVSKMPEHSKHATFLNIEKRVHGFSGMYLDDTGKLNVYTTDSSIKSIDKSILADYVEPQDLAKGIVVKQSNHSWHKWMQLENIALKLFDNKNLGITMTDIDEKDQVFLIGFESLSKTKTDTVNKFLTDHNIPQDMVKIITTGKVMPVSGGTVSPLAGGAQLGITNGGTSIPTCTLGFTAYSNTYNNYVGVTAGHCQSSSGWSNPGTQTYAQPLNGPIIGTEIAGSDPQTSRFSDSLLFALSSTPTLGRIYVGSPSQLTITGKGYNQLIGQDVYSYGDTSGLRHGPIKYTGVTMFDNGINAQLYDQTVVNFSSQSGDSGSPTYMNNPSGGVTLYGTVWATFGAYDSMYSPIAYIEADQGSLQVN